VGGLRGRPCDKGDDLVGVSGEVTLPTVPASLLEIGVLTGCGLGEHLRVAASLGDGL